ncbi:2,4-dienoyl-CoA reductase-like NADH-dependent reductase (Old Yellow Enzyme family)/thioredoxin reductase [Clostridium algifaecis]|uniref:2,4-dienoyl-CoA reductase-like NADH-dependent reductase (Old Yellow Enzyme family)/thioredoxin reductase n=1 Tax=Clostridium algifaecis TaxID=1472040 RepID=A0ABS4KVE3_9CLOT|nr:FAD-dependent oxidoreductase [Clostridium algifaecis]MBP2033985.1 2,4-dienoyl-CoA reductase-like NADH-dependent reductase (Old Yellow Enzyme family)/thioredoxin reductase [Clostridium algifaecis]
MFTKEMFQNMFKPGKIGNLEIKNSLVVPPMLSEYADEDGNFTERYIRYYEEKAKGGFGLIIAEDNAVEARGAGFTKLAGLWYDSQIEKHKEFTSRIQAYGAKIFVQIYHAGREASKSIIGKQPVAPSPVHDPAIFEIPHELTLEEVIELEDKFVDSIVRAQKAGYDGIELHGAHGYLINQFVPPFSNKRTDIYGGNLINRLRFPLNIINKAYEKVGRDFVITYRISADEFVEGGLTIEDSKIIAPILEAAGIKAIHVSGAVYKTGYLPSAPYQAATALFSDLAKEIKSVVNIPVIAVNKINTPFIAESILKQGKSDFVAIGRASIADPEFPNKVMEGRLDDIIPCISCDQGCQGHIGVQKPVSCLVNPRTGREGEYNLEKVANPKKIMIIGAGLAGMQAGVIAAIPSGKEVFNSFVVYLKGQLDKHKVKVHLNTEVTEEIINTFNPDYIILSAGANPITIPFKGIEKNKNVVQANEILSGKVMPGRNIAIVGGGLVGMETAEHLAVHESSVTVIEMKETHLEEMAGIPKAFMIKSLEHNKVDIRLGTKLEEIRENSIVISKNGNFEEILVDQIILAIGSRPNLALEEIIKGKYSYTKAGDITGVADGIISAKEGYEAALNIK